ncbi:MAG TPA: aromatic amino acid lyase, partial [Gemmatimonadales bacterium]
MSLVIDGASLTLAQVVDYSRRPEPVQAAPGALGRVAGSRNAVEALVRGGATMYGINTGFGKLANVRIPRDQLDRLQANLIRSHAAGIGHPLPPEVVRAMLLLRANVLLRPTSGVRPDLITALLAMANAGIVPWVPEQGSVGASGDLAPLAHLALALMGEGEVMLANGARAPAGPVLAAAGLEPFRFA